jgi:hypothetical protein
VSTRQAGTARRLATDPLVPLAVLAAVGLTAAGLVSAAGFVPVAAWAALGGLAGYTLSGSV